jgi:hypothetical protein
MIEVLKCALAAAKLNERHQTIAESYYWLRQYKLLAEKAIAELESQEPVAWMVWGENNVPALTFTKPANKYVFDALYTHPPQRTWVDLTEEELRIAFGKLYPSDISILELAENNKDYAVEAIGARHHWTAFKAGARAGEAKLKEKNT